MNAEQGYRFLTTEDTIQKTDEGHLDEWVPALEYLVGKKWHQMMIPYRRKVEPAEGWIKLSEQMPKEFPCQVYGVTGVDVCHSIGSRPNYCFFHDKNGQYIVVTHWKPLKLSDPPKPEISESEKAFEAWWISCSSTGSQGIAREAWEAALNWRAMPKALDVCAKTT